MPTMKSAPWCVLWRIETSARSPAAGAATTPARVSSATSAPRALTLPIVQTRDRAFDHRALEEVRIHRRVQPRGVLERELAEVPLVDHAVLDQLPRLFEHFGHVGHVVVADVGAEERVELVRIAERPRRHPIVRFTG